MGDYGPDASRWQMQRGHSRSWPHEEIDWAPVELPASPPFPRHHRHWEESHRPAFSAYPAARSSVATSRQKSSVTRAASVLLSSPSGMRHHSSDNPLVSRPPAAPYLLRSSASSSEKAATFPYYTEQPQPDLSYRDLNPPLPADYFRSTSNSRRSVSLSPFGSDGETEFTRPTPVGYVGYDEYKCNAPERETSRSIYKESRLIPDSRNFRKDMSQEHRTSSTQRSSTRQSDMDASKQKRKQHLHSRSHKFESESDEEEMREERLTIKQKGTYPRRSHRQLRSRRGSGSRGPRDGNSSKSRKHESTSSTGSADETSKDDDTESETVDFNDDRQRRRAASRDTKRSISRHTTATNDHRRNMSRSESRIRRGVSDDFNPRVSSRRSVSRLSPGYDYKIT